MWCKQFFRASILLRFFHINVQQINSARTAHKYFHCAQALNGYTNVFVNIKYNICHFNFYYAIINYDQNYFLSGKQVTPNDEVSVKQNRQ